MGKAIPLKPKDSRYNGGQKCDMAEGPCSCGAWHENLKKLKKEQKKRIDAVNGHEDKLMQLNNALLQNIKKHLPELEELRDKINGHWYYEDFLYRLYHQSFKVYYCQELSEKMVTLLKSLAPEGCTINKDFEEIHKEGTGKIFNSEHNNAWLKNTRPMIECFLHCKAFLEMACKYGRELEGAPTGLPNGWALLLYFYSMR